MIITVKRLISNADETLSAIYVDDDLVCYGLEDERREVKIAGETRIPAGEYPVKLRTEGSIHPRYAKSFGGMHKGMLWLQGVPGFEWVYFHMGNTDEHTAGCILAALGTVVDDLGTITLQNSRNGYVRLYERVVDAAWHGTLTVEIMDEESS